MFDGIDSTVQPLFVAPEHLSVWASRVRPHIDKMAAGSAGRYEGTDILTAIAAGRMQLWVALGGADLLCVLVTEVHTYPRLRALRLIGLSGHRPRLWAHLLGSVEQAAARHFGCTRMEAVHIPRFGAILPGYRTTHWFSEKAIG